MPKKRIWIYLFITWFLLLVSIFIFYCEYIKVQEKNSEEVPKVMESIQVDAKDNNQKQDLLFYDLIEKKVSEMNGNGYRIVELTIEDTRVINSDLEIYQLISDVIMEKDGLYDWLRIKTLIQKDQIFLMERVPISYYDRLSSDGYWSIGSELEHVIQNAIESLTSEDRSYFGIDKRSFRLGAQGIEEIQVNKITPITSNSERTEVLVSINLIVKAYQKQITNEYWFYLRQYENKKWQIEDIQQIGGTTS